MSKNNNALSKLFSNLFGDAAKQRRELNKMKKYKQQYLKLDVKVSNNTITKKELDMYNNLKEELKKMASKYEIEDGKLVLKKDSSSPQQVEQVQEPSRPQVREQVQEEQQYVPRFS